MRKLAIGVLVLALLMPGFALSESQTIDKESILAFVEKQQETMRSEASRMGRADVIIRFLDFANLSFATIDVSLSEDGAEKITTYSIKYNSENYSISVRHKYSGFDNIWLDFENKSSEPDADTAIALYLSVQPYMITDPLNYFADIPLIESAYQSLANGLRINKRQTLYAFVGDYTLNYYITKNQDDTFAHSIRVIQGL